MRYKRSSRNPRHFRSPEFRPFSPKWDFFNTHRSRVENRRSGFSLPVAVDVAFATSPQSGLTWFRFLFPLIEPGLADFPHPALGKDSRFRPRKTRDTVW